MKRVVVKRGTYRDSISLMKLSDTLQKLPGVTEAAVVMATELNRRVLSEAGFDDPAIQTAGSDDMIVAIDAGDEGSLQRALEETGMLLSRQAEIPTGGAGPPATLGDALETLPDANLVLVSVPGQFAKREAAMALARGLNVFLFSSNVAREDELELKTTARDGGLLVMGPDCGTSIINHTVLGFGNKVREGFVGLVSASGTGLQEVTTLIHKAGLGISQAIGTGGGDLSEIVGGITMIQGLELLEGDEKTKVVVLISKPPSPGTMQKVLEAASRCRKPVVANFLGGKGIKAPQNVRLASTLDEAALAACELGGLNPGWMGGNLSQEAVSLGLSEHGKLAKSQLFVRGLFSGGTLCYESQLILEPLIGRIRSNGPIGPENQLDGESPSVGNTCIDMGAEEFVVGRAHPMIDFTLRKMRIIQEAEDPQSAVILLDVELGYGSNADPAGQLAPVIRKAKVIAESQGRHLSVVASIIGTDGDFQNLKAQSKTLADAGVLLMPSNAQATSLAALIVSGIAPVPSESGRSN